MPTKSNNMSPMPMQPKIGEASLKFGPDWLRALSSSETTGSNAINSPSPGGDGGRAGFGFSGWGGGGNSDGRSGFASNKDYLASSHFSSPQSFHHQHHQSARDAKGSTPPNSNSTRFKQSEHCYSREEMLALYDKNLDAPSFLLSFGTLLIEKMQPPLAFSQPSEDEIRIWHSPQPESSRQGPGAAPIGRGYAIRGRGGGIERGRGRGRGGYYSRPHEDEERGSFSRPRNFERSQSNHERTAWGERNGVAAGPGPVGLEEGNRGGGGGNWRSRDFGGSTSGRRHDENDDGWRKPRWRRGDEDEDALRSGNSSRRLHRSWSEDENHDNMPEWARDNPSEESGTFDSTGAFHGEDQSGKNREPDRKQDSSSGSSNNVKSRVESEPSGSHNDRVQRRAQDRNESGKPVIPASVKEEVENQGEEGDYTLLPNSSRASNDRSEHFSSISNQHHTVNSIIQKHETEVNKDGGAVDARQHQHQYPQQPPIQNVGIMESQKLQKQHMITAQHQMTASHGSRAQITQSVSDRNISSVTLQQQQREMRASTHDQSILTAHGRGSHNEEDHYRSMTEEAMNLVSKLIEDDAAGSRRGTAAVVAGHGLRMPSGTAPQQQQLLNSGVNAESTNSATMNVNDRPRNVPIPTPNIPPTAHPPAVSPSSFSVWFYRDPQGSVQGPFSTQEMDMWYKQGYFTGTLFLRRECDKIFITLSEMGKLYEGNPFEVNPESSPPPIQNPNPSALDFPRGDANPNPLQAQIHQQRQQQLLQQNMLREQQVQYMMNLGHSAVRKEEPGWQGPNMHAVPQPNRSAPHAPSLSAEQIQAQLLMSMAKSQGIDRDSNAMDQLQALFQRQQQLKSGSNDAMMPPQGQKSNFPDMLPTRHNTPMDVPKSPAPVSDPIQSLVQQLTSMANTQQHKIGSSTKPDVINPWGTPASANPAPAQAPPHWGSHNNPTPWEFRDQMAVNQKMQHEEEIRRRKEEEEAERKRLDDENLKREEERQRVERERKRLEDQQRMEEEKQRKIREEQYLIQKQQQDLIRKQQEDAEINRQKELLLQRQLEQRQLEQQRQLRDEQTRLAEEQQQRMEQQRLEKERQEKELAERELKLRQERERQEQLKMQQQFTWNSNTAAQPPSPVVGNKSLLEIQQEEAIKQEKEASIKKKQQQEQLRVQQQQQAQQQKAINLKWAQSAAPTKAPIKSLTEIQAEEQAKLQKQQEKEREKRAIIHQHQQQQQAWSAQLTWANRASALAASGSKKVNGGVWEDTSMASKLKSGNNQSSGPSFSNNRSQQQSSVGKKTKEMSEESFMKLFTVQDSGEGAAMQMHNKGARPKQSVGNCAQDEFTRWCFERVQVIGGDSVDIPTFVGFLKEVESPYEVGDYIRSYLGDGKEARDFSREFLERRSRWKNARKDGGGSLEDNLCRPASAVNPNSNDFQEVKAKGKKTKKGKMQKVDSRILGFSTSAATDRLNVGNRDYGDSTD